MPGRRPKQQYKARLPSITDGIFDDLEDMPRQLPRNLWPIQQEPPPRPPRPQRPPPQPQEPRQPFEHYQVPNMFNELIRKVRFIESWEKAKFENSELWNEYRNGPREYMDEYNTLRSFYDPKVQRYKVYSTIADVMWDRFRVVRTLHGLERLTLSDFQISEYNQNKDRLENMLQQVMLEQNQQPLTNPPRFRRRDKINYPRGSFEHQIQNTSSLFRAVHACYERYFQIMDDRALNGNQTDEELADLIFKFHMRESGLEDVNEDYRDAILDFIELMNGGRRRSIFNIDYRQRLRKCHQDIKSKIRWETVSRNTPNDEVWREVNIRVQRRDARNDRRDNPFQMNDDDINFFQW